MKRILIFVCVLIAITAFAANVRVPTPLAPANNLRDAPRVDTLRCSSVGNVTYYFEYAIDRNFMPPIFPKMSRNPYCVTDSLATATTYYWHVRARDNKTGKTSNWSTVFAFTTFAPPIETPLPIWAMLSEYPDTLVYKDAPAWFARNVRYCDSLGTTGIILNSRFYGGTWGIDWGDPYHFITQYGNALATCVGYNQLAILWDAKISKCPMSASALDWDYWRLKRLWHAPRNLLADTASALYKQRLGIVTPDDAGRTFIAFQIDSDAIDRHYTLAGWTSDVLALRLYQTDHATGKFVDLEVNGDFQFDFALPDVAAWTIFLRNNNATNVEYRFDDILETIPENGWWRSIDDSTFAWYGNHRAFEVPCERARYDDPASVDRFAYVLDVVWRALHDVHHNLIREFVGGDEEHANAHPEFMPSFRKNLAMRRALSTNVPIIMYGDPFSPYAGAITSGWYANNMQHGGFANAWDSLDASTPIEYVVYGGDCSVSELRLYLSKSRGAIYLHIPCDAPIDAPWGALAIVAKFKNSLAQLTVAERARFAWWLYTEQRDDVLKFPRVIAAIRA